MELLKDVLAKALENEEIQIVFPNLSVNAKELVELTCFQILSKIKAALENDSLSDYECIEEIICIFEDCGSKVGDRHDY